MHKNKNGAHHQAIVAAAAAAIRAVALRLVQHRVRTPAISL